MAIPLTADQLLAAMRRVGLNPREVPGWRTRGMDRMARKGFEPRGVCVHHTAGGLGTRTVMQYIDDIINGDPAVPDKCHFVIDPDGGLWMNAAGRANHDAYVSQRALDAMLAGSFPTTGSVAWRGSIDTGNRWSYGMECIAAGTPNAAQRATAVLVSAGLCLAHRWAGGETFGHGEVADDRDWSDPGWNMGAFRADVMATIKRLNSPITDTTITDSTEDIEMDQNQFNALMTGWSKTAEGQKAFGSWDDTFGRNADGTERVAMRALQDTINNAVAAGITVGVEKALANLKAGGAL